MAITLETITVFKTSGIWVIRDRKAGKDLAHEATKKDALTVARRLNKS